MVYRQVCHQLNVAVDENLPVCNVMTDKDFDETELGDQNCDNEDDEDDGIMPVLMTDRASTVARAHLALHTLPRFVKTCANDDGQIYGWLTNVGDFVDDCYFQSSQQMKMTDYFKKQT